MSDTSFRNFMTPKQLALTIHHIKKDISLVAFASQYAQKLVEKDLREIRNDLDFILSEIKQNEAN